MLGGCFWEGSCSVTGLIAGDTVNGKAYVELTHTWKNNQAILGEIQNSQIIPLSQQYSIPSFY